ncbi:MAG: SDR family oxidoreductase [Candidatus Acidiferrales bacterium]
MSPESPVAIVTGASRGIGFAIAAELARRGYRLALLARDQKTLEDAARRLGPSAPEVKTFACDVRVPAQVESAFEQVLAWAGRADVLVNNAGIGGFGAIHELSDEVWDDTLATNLRGVFLCSRAVAPQMIRQRSGYIINISSLAGKNFFAGAAAYCASKWGLMGLTKCMAEDLRGYGIRVTAICPGSVHTEFSPHAGKDPKKMLQPEDVARAVGWLLEQSPTSFASEIELRPTQKP